MDWTEVAGITSLLVGWSLIAARQAALRIDRYAREAQERQEEITERFIDFLQAALERAEDSTLELKRALHGVEAALATLTTKLEVRPAAKRNSREIRS